MGHRGLLFFSFWISSLAAAGTAPTPLSFLQWSPETAVPIALQASSRPLPSLTPERAPASVEKTSPLFPDLVIPARRTAQLEIYRQALQSNSPASCSQLDQLRKEDDFPLQLVANYRFWIHCSAEVGLQEQLPENPPAFLQELQNEALMKVSERNEHWDVYLGYLFLKTRSMKLLREKVKTLEDGLQLATQKHREVETEFFSRELERLAPRFISQPQPEQFLDVGQDWIRVREFEKGRSYFRRLLQNKKTPLAQQRKAFQNLRNSYKVEQDRKNHLAESEKFFRWMSLQSDPAAAFDAGLYWVRALWTEGRRSQAEKELLHIEKAFGKKGRLYDIEHIRGRMAEEDGAFDKALQHYDRALQNGGMGSPLETKLESARAWALRHLDRPLEAAQEYDRIAKTSRDASEQLRARFWQGKSLMQAQQTESAKTLFRQVAFEDPLGYYGLVAFRELDAPIPPLAEPREKALAGWGSLDLEKEGLPTPALEVTTQTAQTPVRLTPAPTSLRRIRTLRPNEKSQIHDLFAAGEKELLQKFLDQLAESSSDEGVWDWTKGDGLLFLKAYAHAGLYLPLFANIGKMEKSDREQLLLAHPELLFPMDFEDLISQASTNEKIPKELVFSIIRQESAFNPNARSFADAMGLMQILPDPAQRLAKGLSLPFRGHEDLFTPEFNIPVGTRLLRQGLERYQGNYILAIASYNANDRAIRNWLKTRFREDPVEFIEEIAYEETRTYVKLVLRNYIFYKRLANPRLALNFPAECLPDLQNFKNSDSPGVVSRQ